MPHITLTEEQARAVTEAGESLEVHDPQGRIVALLQPVDPHEVEALLRFRQRRASTDPEPAIPSARVQAMLQKLDEIDRREGITAEKAANILRKLRAGEEL